MFFDKAFLTVACSLCSDSCSAKLLELLPLDFLVVFLCFFSTSFCFFSSGFFSTFFSSGFFSTTYFSSVFGLTCSTALCSSIGSERDDVSISKPDELSFLFSFDSESGIGFGWMTGFFCSTFGSSFLTSSFFSTTAFFFWTADCSSSKKSPSDEVSISYWFSPALLLYSDLMFSSS